MGRCEGFAFGGSAYYKNIAQISSNDDMSKNLCKEYFDAYNSFSQVRAIIIDSINQLKVKQNEQREKQIERLKVMEQYAYNDAVSKFDSSNCDTYHGDYVDFSDIQTRCAKASENIISSIKNPKKIAEYKVKLCEILNKIDKNKYSNVADLCEAFDQEVDEKNFDKNVVCSAKDDVAKIKEKIRVGLKVGSSLKIANKYYSSKSEEYRKKYGSDCRCD
jgi:hypothetical protein